LDILTNIQATVNCKIFLFNRALKTVHHIINYSQ